MWIVTKRFVDINDNEDPILEDCNVGSANIPKDYPIEKLPYKFRMLTDDNEVMAIGYSDDCSTDDAFAPLDDYGEGAFGCTMIEYINEAGEWELL